jgi:hypothetical protein
MSNRRGWRWRVLEVYPDARCNNMHDGKTWNIDGGIDVGYDNIGTGCTPVMAVWGV